MEPEVRSSGAKLIQYQSDPIEAFREINLKKITSEEKYSNNDVSDSL